MSLFLKRCILPGSNTQVGTIHGSLWYWSTGRANEELQEVLNSEMSIFHIFRLLPSLNKCGPFLLGRYSTTMRRECGQECVSYLLSTMWFPAPVRPSPLFGGHIVLESRLIGKLFLRVFWGFLSLVEYISEKPVNSKCTNWKLYSRQSFWRLGCGEDRPTSDSFYIHFHLPPSYSFDIHFPTEL